MTFPILQFGTSRFLQAHVDLFVSEALKRGEAIGEIVAVQTTANPASRRRIEAFARGTPYRVKIRGLAQGAVVDRDVEVDSVRGGLDANEHWPDVERSFIEATCVISNTADRGYELHAGDALDGPVPRSFPAKLAKLLVARHRTGAPPVTLFPCELTPANGDTLRAIVLGVLEGWRIDEATRRWVGEDCVFVNSLVDRIVSEPIEPLGAVAEPYALWAIEDRPGLTPPCRHADVVVTDNLKRYEQLKLFILNLGHSWLAETWSQTGRSPGMTVREAMADEALRASLDEIYESEVLPVFLAMDMGEDARAYRASVIERFCNPFLDHRLAEIHVNHAAKKSRRFGGLIALARAQGLTINQPKLAATLAGEGGDRPGLSPGV